LASANGGAAVIAAMILQGAVPAPFNYLFAGAAGGPIPYIFSPFPKII